MQGKVPPHPTDPDWARLLDAEQALEAQIAAGEAEARMRVAEARAVAAAAVPDPAAIAALAAAEEEADNEQQRRELARIAAEADATVRAFVQAPDSVLDALAQLALGAVLADELAEERR